ncbi:hypothetical protein [Paenibacillus tepidiphilus]|uniref:hypothetical protein n=1 Tax=Paenibacillus tepidiphilus TaxID=2608683 RepID=UPI001238B34D|nr:hypothetical protein [Paenibacillus tepidiphilus]
MAYIRLMVLVLAFEVFITVVLGLGIYYGFSIYPYAQAAAAGTEGQYFFHITIPLYMPSLTDLKVPYTYLQPGAGIELLTIVISVAVAVLQSFVRGMYLGGLKGWALKGKAVPLIACGKKYFIDMIAWSFLVTVFGWVTVFLSAFFFPLGLALMVVLMLYSLTPYLIVLQNITLTEALAKASRLLRRYFSSLLPLTILALLITFLASIFRPLPAPWGYAVPLLIYVSAGTWVLSELLKKLTEKLRRDGEKVPGMPFTEVRPRRGARALLVVLVPLLITAGIYGATGRHLSIFASGSTEQLPGVSYHANFSDVFYASDQMYTAYEWEAAPYSLAVTLPDLSGERKPRELQGIADITWKVREDYNVMHSGATEVLHKNRIMYRLVRETARDGSVYYSSMGGSAAILPGGEEPREPLSFEMMVSGDGTHIYVLQYPSRFESAPVFRASEDGRYLIPLTSQMNPDDFRMYWFTAEHSQENVFELLEAKNNTNYITTLNRAYLALACAMQEGDGRMVAELLRTMRESGVQVSAPDWNADTWTDDLRGRYQGAGLERTLELLSNAGIQGAYGSAELADQSDDNTAVYRVEVPFPAGPITILVQESKVNGKLLSVDILDAVR